MNRRFGLLAFFLLSVGVAGCGDSPVALVRDLLTFWNEVCDNTLRVTDDKSATRLLKAQFKLLDARRDVLKARAEKRLSSMPLDKDGAVEVETALVDYYYEIIATEKRFENCQKRLKKLVQDFPESQSIKDVLKWTEDKREFHSISLGKFMPKDTDPKMPKQFGKGLVLPWPQLQAPPPKPPPAVGGG